MKYLQLVHRFGCLGYTLLGIVSSFLLLPVSYFVFRSGDQRLIASVSTIELTLISFAAALVVVYWRNPGLLMASAVWVPIYFVSYIAVLISYNFDGYLLSGNPHFSEWGTFFLSLLVYQLPVVLIYVTRQRARR